ncbi:3-phosphoserine/phosphohydroxythreonine transaminase [Acutalibacter sp. 1XD8-33]|uniref:3-phosphoserine/phosphohydroxythreonine transaminase n=1 Tax=Acutalibacter sp. 1XD8-33 TaxID=2320081 RepID=UPI000EA3FD59|nr:3-phosphoserine/phosphohydroxythreonine transaminase [Acutalibacter sp. 1XD8-33]RKJ41393.1 3-phosphoserine/phosphohydroxythreonine transaminase [Acutalibacter sp. 1XD8-33]
MNRVYNFSAGPSMLPEPVLQKAAGEILNYEGSGQSVMEMSHRSGVFEGIMESAQSLLREVMGIPQNYKVLFLQGGASSQFAAVPMNLMTGSRKADYVLSGQFSTKAFQEGSRYGDCKAVASSKEDNFSHIPYLDKNEFRPDADYFHICMNNTIYGTLWHELPDTGNVPLVADISSCILSQPIDVAKFGLLYAGAQKNVAPAGLTIVIVREDLIGEPQEGTPTMFNYGVMAKNDSMYNTPPCWPIYICKLVLDWIKEDIGGLKAMEERNVKKAQVLYDFLDSSRLFKPCAEKDSRSIMNVTFVTGDKDLDGKFVKEATEAGFVNLKGHRSVGGMRASIYNAMPPEGIDKLVEFMAKFEKENS